MCTGPDQPFVKGLDLIERFYEEVIKPLLCQRFPGLEYSAALLGPGSEVLGYDTVQSTDHDWGPRLLLFIGTHDFEANREQLDALLRRELPETFGGYPTRFRRLGDGTTAGGSSPREHLTHGIRLLTVSTFSKDTLGFDSAGAIRAADWLGVPQHRLLTIAAGRVFHDGLGQLQSLRQKLSYYPHDIWLYVLAAQWRRISQEEAFMGRCGQVGDDLGSALIAARQVQDLMRLCFLMERRYTPYVKWLGTAFAELDCATYLQPVLRCVLASGSWEERQRHLAVAYEFVAQMHNALGITQPLATKVSPYFNRPFMVIDADKFSSAILAVVVDEEVRALPEHLGSVDQFVDSTDAWHFLDRLKEAYQ